MICCQTSTPRFQTHQYGTCEPQLMHMYNHLYSRKPGILLPHLQQHHHGHLTPYRSSLRCIIRFLRRLHPSLFRVVEFVPESSPISPSPPKDSYTHRDRGRILLNGPVHEQVRPCKWRHHVEELRLGPPVGVEDGRARSAGKGLLSVGGDGVGYDAFLGLGTWSCAASVTGFWCASGDCLIQGRTRDGCVTARQ